MWARGRCVPEGHVQTGVHIDGMCQYKYCIYFVPVRSQKQAQEGGVRVLERRPGIRGASRYVRMHLDADGDGDGDVVFVFVVVVVIVVVIVRRPR